MKLTTAGTVVLAPIDKIKPHPQNARTHSTRHISQIKKTIPMESTRLENDGRIFSEAAHEARVCRPKKGINRNARKTI